jgi:hypothetical protein
MAPMIERVTPTVVSDRRPQDGPVVYELLPDLRVLVTFDRQGRSRLYVLLAERNDQNMVTGWKQFEAGPLSRQAD